MSYLTDVSSSSSVQRLMGHRYAPLHALLLAVGLWLFVAGNTHEGLWLDESFTAALVKQTPIQIIRSTAADNHPPLYYLGLHLFIGVVGDSVFNLRLFSALGALGLAALGVGPIRRATNARVGLLYTFLVVATPGSLTQGQEARMYSWSACLVTGCAVYAFLASRDNRRIDWTLFGLFSLAAAYTHYYPLLAVVLIHSLMLVWSLGWRPIWWRRYLVTAGLVGLAYLPWLIPLGLQTRRVVGDFWIAEVSPRVVQDSLLFPFGYKWSFPLLPQMRLAFGLVVCLGVGGCLHAIRQRLPARGLLVLCLGVYSLMFVTIVAISYSIRPILTPRYMATVMGLLLLPAAFGLAAVPWRALRLALCGAFLVLTVPILGHIQQEQFNGPWPDVIHTLSVQAEPDALFIHTSLHTLAPLAYYFPDATHLLYAPWLKQRQLLSFYGPHAFFEPDIGGVTSRVPTIWLVGCGQPECGVVDEWVASGQLGHVVERYDYREPYSWLSLVLARLQPGQP